MDWRRSRRSENVQQVGGGGRRVGRGGGLSLGGIALVVVIGLALGRSPLEIVGLLIDSSSGPYQGQSAPPPSSPEQAEQVEFVKAILGSTEDTWGAIFREGGGQYPAPRLILFQGAVGSACGSADSSVGPFYCPADSRVYLDLTFFRQMEVSFRAAGDLARAYVIAHEVGHHVQNVLGVMDKVRNAERRGSAREGADGLSVRQELQADCYAGLWAKDSDGRLQWLEPGDVESALAAATAIGDDALQRQSRGVVVPDSFTHGTSEQRVRWFKVGMSGKSLDDCDTFNASQL